MYIFIMFSSVKVIKFEKAMKLTVFIMDKSLKRFLFYNNLKIHESYLDNVTLNPLIEIQ